MNDLIKKITAPNGGIFTGQGTNTYLIGNEDITLIDPGPYISEHIEAILEEGKGKIKRILVTHTHTDHSPASLPISGCKGGELVGAPRSAHCCTPKRDI